MLLDYFFAVLFCVCFSSVRCCRIVDAVLFCVCFSSVRCCRIVDAVLF